MSIARITTLKEAYQDALTSAESADTAAAWGAAIVALMRLAAEIKASPDVSRSLGDGGNQSIRWTEKDLASERKYLTERQQLARRNSAFSSGPFQQTPVTYQRVSSTDDFA